MRHGLSFVCAFLLAAAGFPSVAFLQTSPVPTPSEPSRQEAVELILGKPIERELKSGEKHVYTITLNEKEYAEIEFEQKGIDVEVAVFNPNGMKLADLISVEGTQGSEVVYLAASLPGQYVLEMQAAHKNGKPGRYEARITFLRPADSKDFERMEGQRLFNEGRKLTNLANSKSREEEIEKYKSALVHWQAAEDRHNEAFTIHEIGTILFLSAKYKEAFEYYQKSLTMSRTLGDREQEARALNVLGRIFSIFGDKQKAIEHYEKSLLISREDKDWPRTVITLTTMGKAYSDSGNSQKALDIYSQALSLSRSIKDQSVEATLLTNISAIYSNLNEFQKAYDFLMQGLMLRRAMGDQRGEAVSLNSLGVLLGTLGENQKALENYLQSLQLRRAAQDRLGEAVTLVNIGNIHKELGNLPKALDTYSQALSIQRAINDRRGEAQTHAGFGHCYLQAGELQKAVDSFLQALALHRASNDPKAEALTLANIGLTYRKLGEFPKAHDYFAQALSLNRIVGNRRGQAVSLFFGARLDRDQGNLTEARMKMEESIKLIESVRSDVPGQNLRSSFFATIRGYYDLYIDTLMRMHKADPKAGHDLEALQASERARARSLLELLAESRADIRQGVDPQLLEQEHTAQDRLRVKQEALTQLLVGKHTPDQADEAKKEIDALTDEYRQIQTKIRQTSPRYAALTQPEPLTVKQLQQTVLDSDTVLLEYALGDDQSYVWAVTTDSVTAVELPKRADIEAAAREFYELLKAPPPASPELVRTADKLSRMILAPVADKLGDKRLVVVADGALQYVPFAALPEPQADPKRKTEPLVVRHEIVSLPSASALAVLRNETKDRKPAEKILAVLADPVFSPKDKRLTEQAASVAAKQPETEDFGRSRVLTRMAELADASSADRAAGETKLTLPRLLNSRREADQISRFVEPDRLLKALDFEAGREAATGGELSKYRYLHFATHGLLDTQRPELSSIVLSLVDKDGNLKDGFLRAFDIYNLNLPAELAVLSACKTGLGKEIRGEGLVGLTRGFMYAGTRRVVVSLWSVDDAATGELMARFYKKMLKDGMRPAAALRSAQVEMWGDKQWTAPFFWAAFALQGEWK